MAAAIERLVNAWSRTVHIAAIEEILLLGNIPYLSSPLRIRSESLRPHHQMMEGLLFTYGIRNGSQNLGFGLG